MDVQYIYYSLYSSHNDLQF